MKTNTVLAACTAVLALASLSGCAVSSDQVGYRYEHGDRIDADGRRDVGWCTAHANNDHCRTSVADSQ